LPHPRLSPPNISWVLRESRKPLGPYCRRHLSPSSALLHFVAQYATTTGSAIVANSTRSAVVASCSTTGFNGSITVAYSPDSTFPAIPAIPTASHKTILTPTE
jgi:hypothetical protein